MSVVDRWQAAWNSHDGKQVAALYVPDGIRHHMFTDEESPYSPGAIVDLANGAFEAWPDATLDVRATIEGPDGTVAVEWTWRGTHEKEWRGLPAKGEATHLYGINVFRLEGELIKEEHVYWDNAALMAQAGLLP